MQTCPTGGRRLWPAVAHEKTGKDLPAFATVRWVCRRCGWPSQGADSGAASRDDGPDSSGKGPIR